EAGAFVGATAAGIPARRWREFAAARAVLAHVVVFAALVGILQDFIGLAEVLETLLGVLLLADVRMVFAREAPVGLLDVVGRRLFIDAHDFVIVFEFHARAFSSFRTACIVPGNGGLVG